MPKQIVKKELNKIFKNPEALTDEEIVDLLAKKFKVSPPAMSYRLLNLKLIHTS